jgi:hypothetical protein
MPNNWKQIKAKLTLSSEHADDLICPLLIAMQKSGPPYSWEPRKHNVGACTETPQLTLRTVPAKSLASSLSLNRYVTGRETIP